MKHLVLMRHAQADDPIHGQQDWERPLTRRGMHDAAEMARRLKTRKWRPDLMLVSPALRTRQTAEAVIKLFPHAAVAYPEDLYLASCKQLMHILHEHGHDAAHLLVIGHNPGISEFADALSQERPIDAMPTAACVCASFDIAEWKELAAASGVNVELDYPQRCG